MTVLFDLKDAGPFSWAGQNARTKSVIKPKYYGRIVLIILKYEATLTIIVLTILLYYLFRLCILEHIFLCNSIDGRNW